MSNQAPASEPDTNVQFTEFLTSKIRELEKISSAGNAKEREAVKAHKKALREVLKEVQNVNVPLEERMELLQSKYTQMAQDHIRVEKQLASTQEQLDNAIKERDKAQEELRKSNMQRLQLEELCRQLQKKNKDVMDDSRRMSEEQAALQTRMQAAVADITSKIEAQAAERAAQLAENDSLRAKLSEVFKQFDAFNTLVATKDKEVQLITEQLERHQLVNQKLTERNGLLESANNQLLEINKRAQEQLDAMVQTQITNKVLQETNTSLKEQLDSYNDKFSEFQQTLLKSNEVFDGLKKELDKGAKLRGELLKERDELRRRTDSAEARVVDLTAREQEMAVQVTRLNALVKAVDGVDAEEVKKLKQQKDALEALCRTLQAQVREAKNSKSPNQPESTTSQNTSASSVLKEHGITVQDTAFHKDQASAGTEQQQSDGVDNYRAGNEQELIEDQHLTPVINEGPTESV